MNYKKKILCSFWIFITVFFIVSFKTNETLAVESPERMIVNENNFTDYFNLNNSIYENNILSLTQDGSAIDEGHSGNATLKNKINTDADFVLQGYVNVGTKSKPDQNDGIGFGFHQGLTTAIGGTNEEMGLMGLPKSFGFKLDTWINTSRDDPKFGTGTDRNGTSFGGFLTTDSYNYKQYSTDMISGSYMSKENTIENFSATSAAKPIDSYRITSANNSKYNSGGSLPDGAANTWVSIKVVFSSEAKVLYVSYNYDKPDNPTWALDLSTLLKSEENSDASSLSFLISASNFASQNGQQFKFGSDGYFTYAQYGVITGNFISDSSEPEEVSESLQETDTIGETRSLKSFSNQILDIESTGQYYLTSGSISDTTPDAQKNPIDLNTNTATFKQQPQNIDYIFKQNQGIINAENKTIYAGQDWSSSDNFISAKNYKGDPLSVDDMVIENDVNTSIPGTYTVSYKYADESNSGYQGNSLPIVSKKVNVVVLPCKVISRYVDEEGKEISTATTQSGRVGDAYKTTAPIISGYALKTTPDNATGVYTADTITVTYVYRAIIPETVTKGTVTSKYVDQDGAEIATSTSQSGRIGDAYTTKAATIPGYALDLNSLPTNNSGTFKADTKDEEGNTTSGVTVTYVYNKIDDETIKSGTVTTKYVDEAGEEIATATTQTGRIGDTYTTSATTISGYALKTTPENASGTYKPDTTDSDNNPVSGVTVTYVYKKITNEIVDNGTVTTKYVDESGESIASSSSQTGRIDDAYTTSAVTVSGYALKTTPANASGKFTSDAITVTYIYKKVDSPTTITGKVTTKYVDEAGESIALATNQTGRVGDAYTTNASVVSGYALKTTPENASGSFTLDDITVTYVYKKITPETVGTGEVITKYVDESGEEIKTATTQTGRVGDAYATTAPTISGYTLKTTPENASGTYTKEAITVTYVYKKVDSGTTVDGTVTTKYVDESGEEIKTATTQTGRVGDAYATTAPTISGYTLKTTPENASGTYTKEAITVTYVYKKVDSGTTVDGTVTTKYVDESGEEIKTATTQTGRVGDAYATTAPTISGYTLKATPENASGTYTKEAITVTYVYKKVDSGTTENGTVTTKYVDEAGEEIKTATTQTGRVGDAYATSGIAITGYALKTAPENASGTFTKEAITVTYVYKKVDSGITENGTVTTKYVDESGEEIQTAATQTGRVGDTYATSGMAIAGYALKTTPENAVGTFTKEAITVTYVYKKSEMPIVENGQVLTKYINGDGTEIAPATTQTGRVGDTYATSGIAIEGYALETTPENASGPFTKETITVTYVYKKIDTPAIENGEVLTQYVDETGKEIAPAVTQIGRVGDTYATSGIFIEGYALNTTPDNALGIFGKTSTSVVYVYSKVNKLIPIFRAYNPNDGDHLYTISKNEYDWVTGLKWHAEGVAFQSVLSDYANAVTVYRLYNSHSGEHFYTTSEKEYNWVQSKGWTKEGIGFYMVPKDKGEAVYRVFNPNATGPGSHLFTLSKKEADWLISLGWRDEEIAFYSPT